VTAADGDVGKVDDILFDAGRWRVRYLVVDAGGWMSRTDLILSSEALSRKWQGDSAICVNLTLEQIRIASGTRNDKPVSSDCATDEAVHYRNPHQPDAKEAVHDSEVETAKSRLWSANTLVGCDVVANDGSAGTLDDLVADTQAWSIVQLVVDGKKWWPGGQVLVPPSCVSEIDWDSRSVRLAGGREIVAHAPPA
jgi:sporulation protein YlmC with PRC-barrel domain